MFCPYRKMFGEVNTGLHAIRFLNIAIVDVLLTIMCAWILYYYILGQKYSFWIILVCFFLLGIMAHRLFCVRTTVDKLLFNSDK
jgi:hypothetical protein